MFILLLIRKKNSNAGFETPRFSGPKTRYEQSLLFTPSKVKILSPIVTDELVPKTTLYDLLKQ